MQRAHASAAANGTSAHAKGGCRVFRRRLSQEYVCIGAEGVSVGSEDRLPVLLLSTILGGGMSSRLFQRVREERGLAYSVYSYADSYADSGILCTFAATVPARAQQVLRLVLGEYRRLLRDGVTANELREAKKQLRGELIFSLESVSSRMRMLAAPLLYGQKHLPVNALLARIDRATRDDVMRVARERLRPERQTLVAMGPVAARSLELTLPRG
jgi:predicted Zn-dependent peptidase